MSKSDRAQVSAVLRHFNVQESADEIIKLADYRPHAMQTYRDIYASFTDDERREAQ
jgi:hypothetical protein